MLNSGERSMHSDAILRGKTLHFQRVSARAQTDYSTHIHIPPVVSPRAAHCVTESLERSGRGKNCKNFYKIDMTLDSVLPTTFITGSCAKTFSTFPEKNKKYLGHFTS